MNCVHTINMINRYVLSEQNQLNIINYNIQLCLNFYTVQADFVATGIISFLSLFCSSLEMLFE